MEGSATKAVPQPVTGEPQAEQASTGSGSMQEGSGYRPQERQGQLQTRTGEPWSQ